MEKSQRRERETEISEGIRKAVSQMGVEPLRSLEILLEIEIKLMTSNVDSLEVLSSHLSAMAVCYKALNKKRECLMYLTKLLQTEKLLNDPIRLAKTYLNISSILTDLQRNESLAYCVKGTEMFLNLRKAKKHNQIDNSELGSIKDFSAEDISKECLHGLASLIRLYCRRSNADKVEECYTLAKVLITQDFAGEKSEKNKLSALINEAKLEMTKSQLAKKDRLDSILRKQCAQLNRQPSLGFKSTMSKTDSSYSSNNRETSLYGPFHGSNERKTYRILRRDRPSSAMEQTSVVKRSSRPFSADISSKKQWPPVPQR